MDAHLALLNLTVSPRYRESIMAFVHFLIVAFVVKQLRIVQHLEASYLVVRA